MTKVRATRFLVLIFVMTVLGCDTKNDFDDAFKKYFIKYYGEDGKQQGVDMIVNDDGTMLLLGNTISPGDEASRIFLVKVSEDGNILWQKKFGNKDEYATDIELTLNGDGSFIILSNILIEKGQGAVEDKHDIHLIILSSDGEPIKDSQLHFFGSQFGNAVTPVSTNYEPVPDKGYIVSGYTTEIKDNIKQNGARSTDLITFFITSDISDSLWTRRIASQLDGEAITVIESDTYDPAQIGNASYKDRPFYLFGYSDALSVGDTRYENNFWSSSLNENGFNSFDSYSGDTSKIEIMSQTIKANGSGFISVGTQTSATNQHSIILVTSEAGGNGLRFSSQPVVVRESKNLEAVSITQSIAGGRYLVVSNETNLAGTTNIWLSKVGSDGEVFLSASFGSATRSDLAGTVRELSDGKIVILGTVELDSQNSKMTLIKLNANGEFLN
ncbi:MAG: hypothetical protein ABI663_05065 [Chryseolinea sp.]